VLLSEFTVFTNFANSRRDGDSVITEPERFEELTSGVCIANNYSSMPRLPTPPPPAPADWPLDKTYAALKKQLAALESLRCRTFREADSDEREWENLTGSILTHGFGENNNNVLQFYYARSVGEHYPSPGGMSDSLLQQSFEKRIEAYADMLRGSINELELILTEPDITGENEPGDDYQFHRDLKTIVGFAARELFIIDNQLDTQLFSVYMANVTPGIRIRVLTNQIDDALRIAVEEFAKRGNFELRSTTDAHDRVIIADDSCWVIGQTIMDTAKKKPAYVVEQSGAGAMKATYEPIWASATSIIRS
jgi:hypothetical protein